MLGKYVCWRTICDFVVTSDFFANVKFYKEQKHFICVSVYFARKYYLGTLFWRNRHFRWSPEPYEGLAICSAKGALSFLSHCKTLSVGPGPGI